MTRTEQPPKLAAIPLRLDFAGGWLDVPGTLSEGSLGWIVNCTIIPGVTLDAWHYEVGGGLGGSAAFDILEGRNPFTTEAGRGVGWQDPAVLFETGFCVWKAGDKPHLVKRTDGSMVAGRLCIQWRGSRSFTAGEIASKQRPYDKIIFASRIAAHAQNVEALGIAMRKSYEAQIEEGMPELPIPHGALAGKYAGAGWGGYAMFLFPDEARRDAATRADSLCVPVEPTARFSPSWDATWHPSRPLQEMI